MSPACARCWPLADTGSARGKLLAADARTALVEDAARLLGDWLQYQAWSKELPGVAVGIAYRGQTLLLEQYGHADVGTDTRLHGDHLFRIASHSKLFTATAIMQLFSEDRLALDDPVAKYLPWFRTDSDARSGHVRIRHLLSHAGGISRDGTTGHWDRLQFPDAEQIISQARAGLGFYDTGQHLKYSNIGYTLLGMIVAAVSGRSYADHVRATILEPLGLAHTVVDVTDDNLARHATGYARRRPGQAREAFAQLPARVMDAATGFSSTAADLLAFYGAHRYGDQRLFPDHIKRDMQHTRFVANNEQWALGFSASSAGGYDFVGHSGGYPGFITRSGMEQGDGLTIVVLTNAIDGPASQLFDGIAGLIGTVLERAADLGAGPGAAGTPPPPDVAGFYQWHWSDMLYGQVGDKLVCINPGLDLPAASFEVFEQRSDGSFVAEAGQPAALPGEPISFVDGDDGNKVRVAAGARHRRLSFSY